MSELFDEINVWNALTLGAGVTVYNVSDSLPRWHVFNESADERLTIYPPPPRDNGIIREWWITVYSDRVDGEWTPAITAQWPPDTMEELLAAIIAFGAERRSA